MSSEKKAIRKAFRDAVLSRDNHRCRVCGCVPAGDVVLDAHHITDRNLMPNGGYVKENGISLCPPCHEKAEVFHSTGQPVLGFSPSELYTLIRASYDLAVDASKRMK